MREGGSGSVSTYTMVAFPDEPSTKLIKRASAPYQDLMNLRNWSAIVIKAHTPVTWAKPLIRRSGQMTFEPVDGPVPGKLGCRFIIARGRVVMEPVIGAGVDIGLKGLARRL
jgi:hypothetical protein